MSNKEKLLNLISKKEEIFITSFSYDEFYNWLEELYYLLYSLNTENELVKRIMFIIDLARFHSVRFRERVSELKGELEVLKRYEIEKLQFK